MSEPMPDALFGVDGTELPEVLPDPSGRFGWRSTTTLPPFELPALPVDSLTPEAVAAALGEDPPVPADEEPDPAAQPTAAQPGPLPATTTQPAAAAQPAAAQPAAAQPAAAQPAAAQPAAAQPGVGQAPVAAPPPAQFAPQAGLPPPGGATSPHTAGPPARRARRLRYRTPLAGASRDPVPHIDFGHRTSRRGPGWPPRTRSNGGAGIALAIGLIVFGLLVYYIITGIVESVARVLPW